MSAAAAPGLRLVPPTPTPVTPPPDVQRRFRRARLLATGLVVTGALLPVALVAAARWLGNAVYPGLILSWAVFVAGGCMVGLVVLIASHTAADFRAAVLAIASIGVGIALLPAAGRIGTEAYVSSHATELEAIAARLRTDGEVDDKPTWIELAPRSRSLSDEIDADGVPGRIRLPCPDIRAIGGRWYLVGCSVSRAGGD